MSTPKRVALYARISTDDGRQFTENQEAEIEEFCERRGWTVIARYIDHTSGRVGPKDRPELAKMFNDAHRGKFAAVVVWALDRLTRQGIEEALTFIRRLTDANVEFHSVTEAQFSTAGPAGDLMIAISAWIAKNERDQLVKRINAGLARAKANGSVFGRPTKVIDIDGIERLHAEGKSTRSIAKEFGISNATVSRRLRDVKATKTA